MQTLAYKVVFRLEEEETDENIYNEGFVMVYINDNNEFIKMEGILTNDYIIATTLNSDIIITIYSSHILYSICSAQDVSNLGEYVNDNSLDVYWEVTISIDELKFPFELEFESTYPNYFDDYDDEYFEEMDEGMDKEDEFFDSDNEEYITERVQLIATEKIDAQDYPKYQKRLYEFKQENVLAGEEWQ